jgi:hypothetical protein
VTVDRNTVAAVAAAMLDEEGPFSVEGRYIADGDLASRARWSAAERRVREAARRAAYLARHATGPATPAVAEAA